MGRAYDAVVVGAGPAGLSAAAEIGRRGGRALVVDRGGAHLDRDRTAPDDLLAGVGGAGLFSDGKHSFFPSATELWRLPDRRALREAYTETLRLLLRHGVRGPPFPSPEAIASVDAIAPPPASGDGDLDWRRKRYPSIYASLEQRRRMIGDLWESSGERPWLGADVVGARRVSPELLAIEVEQAGERRMIEARSLVIATGRLSPRWIAPWLEPLGVRFAFRRLELGCRLEVPSAEPLFGDELAPVGAGLHDVDPKFSLPIRSQVRALTFCTCRDGEIVLGRVGPLHAVSGRADGPPTGRSSVGVLLRIEEEALAKTIAALAFGARPFRSRIGDAGLAPVLAEAFGQIGAALLGEALDRFVARFPRFEAADLHGPCIEGVGTYPASDPDLGLAPAIWVAGDAGGRFRGIVASMVSGRYVAARVIQEIA